MADGKETVGQFAARIKAKYPEYKDKDDRDLVVRIVNKYPEYRDRVDLPEPAPSYPEPSLPSRALAGIGDVAGVVAKAGRSIAEPISRLPSGPITTPLKIASALFIPQTEEQVYLQAMAPFIGPLAGRSVGAATKFIPKIFRRTAPMITSPMPPVATPAPAVEGFQEAAPVIFRNAPRVAPRTLAQVDVDYAARLEAARTAARTSGQDPFGAILHPVRAPGRLEPMPPRPVKFLDHLRNSEPTPIPLSPASPPPPPATPVTEKAVDQAASSVKKALETYPKPKTGPMAKSLRSGGANLKSLGTPGRIIERKLARADENKRMALGKKEVMLRNVVDNLTDVEKDNLVNVRDLGMKPMNTRVAESASIVKSHLDDIARQAKEHVPGFQPLENFFPHGYDAKMLASPEFQERFIKKIMAQDGIDRISALKKFQSMQRQMLDPRSAHLQKHREYDVEGWNRNPGEALRSYFYSATRKIEHAKVFGPNNEKADRLLGMIGNLSDRNYAQHLFREEVFPLSELPELINAEMTKKARGLASILLLSEASISNAFQGVYGSLTQTGIINTAKAIKRIIANSVRSTEDAIASGAASDRMVSKITDELFGAGKAMKQNYLSQTENLNRVFSDTAARVYSDRLLEKIAKAKTGGGFRVLGSDRASLELEAKKLGFRFNVVANRGYFTDKELERMALRFSDFTQGNYDALNLSAILKDPVGATVFQFIATPFIIGRNIAQNVIASTLRGNLVPLGRFLAYAGAVGEIPAQVKALIRGKERPSNPAIRYIENMANVVGFGIVESIMRPILSGYGALAQPPAASVVQQFGKAAMAVSPISSKLEMKESRLKPMTKFLLRYAPALALSATNLPPAISFPTMIGARIAAGRIPKDNARKYKPTFKLSQ